MGAVGCAIMLIAAEARAQTWLPEPSTMTFEATRRGISEPSAVTFEVTRQKLQEPSAVKYEATRRTIDAPNAITFEVARPDLPEPNAITFEVERGNLSEPGAITYVVTRSGREPQSCAEGKAQIEEARRNNDKARLASLMTAVPKICDQEVSSPVSTASSCADGKKQIEAARLSGNKAQLAQLLETVSKLCAGEASRVDTSREKTCAEKYGPGYVVGHILPDGTFYCVPPQAVADAACVKMNSAGYTAVDLNSRGGFNCRPSQRTADTWCSNNRSGSGWSARIKGDNSFDCVKNKDGQRADAAADCRRRFGARLIRVYERNRQWFCEHRTQPQQPVAQQQPGPSATDIATAVIIGAGIAAAAGSRSGTPVAPQPQARCHRGPDGRIHCGRN